MATTQTFETIVSLNAQQAKNEMATLKKALDDLKQKKAEALKDPGTSVKDINKFDKQIKAAEASLKSYSNSVAKTIDTVNNISTASLGDIEKAAREVRRAMKQVTNPDDYNALNVILQHCKDRMDFLKDSTVHSLKEMQGLNHATVNLQRVLGDINGASLNDLTAAASTLQKELNDMSPNTDAFDKASESLQKINTRIQQIHSNQKEANLSIDKYDKEIAAARRSASELARENKLIDATLKNISGSSLRDLEFSLKIVNERLADTKQGSEAFDVLNDKAKALKAQISAVNSEQQTATSLFGKSVKILNDNWGAITQGIGAITGLSSTIRQCVDAYTEMDQEMNNVRKYTGQSMEEVTEMNEELKKMDTRTPRKQLNELAESAGRLGITSKDSILEFVDAADKIQVALGDDLGDGAIDKVGKLAMAFGEDDRLGLRGAMLATGSAINELAQNSSASAGYLVEFTARVAGVGKQVGLTQAQIMGYGAVLDENMQKDEMAATAFSQLLTKMATDTKTFAKMAGVDVKTFTELVKTDMNKAVITLMDNLKSKGGFDQLGRMFGDMGLDGQRAVSVLTTMADKVDDLRQRQEIATDAYKKATSILEEFDVQNETIQGEVDKAKNRFHELTVELGENLLPVVKYTISAGSLLVKSLSVITNFSLKYWKVLVVLTSGIVAYTLAAKAAEIAETASKIAKLKSLAVDKMKAVYTALATSAQTAYNIAVQACTRQITLAAAAQELWNKVILANPYAAALTAMVAVTAAIVTFTLKTDKAIEAQRELNKANEEAATECRSEIAELSSLVKLVQDKSASDDVRTEALKKLKSQYPEYLNNLTLENSLSNNAREAVDKLTDSILAQAKARVYLSKVEELERKKQDVDEEYFNSWWGGMVQNFRSQFQALGNNIAHYTQKGYNALSQGFDGGQFRRGLKGFKDGWNTQTYIEREGYSRDYVRNYSRNHDADILELQNKQNEWLKKYQEVQKQQAESLQKVRKANEALAGGKGSNSTASEDYKSEAERKAEQAESRKAAVAARKAEAERKRQEAQKNKDLKAAVKAQQAITDAELVENYRRYADENLSYKDFMRQQYDIKQQGLDEQIKLYGKDADEAQSLMKKKTELEQQYQQQKLRYDEDEIQREHAVKAIDLQMMYEKKDMNNDLYHDDIALAEAMYNNDIDMLKKRQSLYKKDSQEWLDIDAEISQRQREQDLDRTQRYNDLLERYKEEWAAKDIKEQERITLKGLDLLHKKGLLKEMEYQEMLKQIKLRYAEQEAEQSLHNSRNEQFKRNAHSAYNTASNKAQASWSNKYDDGVNVGAFITSDIDIYASTLANIKSMEQEGLISHEEAMAAMGEATANMCNGLVAKMQAAMDAISPLMSAMSSYYSAQSDYEVTITEKKYEKLINAAGNNTAKRKKLEEKKEKEIAKIKTKYAKKQAAMQIAQAIAQTAISAIGAYSSAMTGMPYPANMVLAPIAAGIAAAAGAIQIATIKKQQQAQEAGYYEGGFTGGSSYRRKAGIVHEGEFVANHNAVNNPQVLPALQLIDEAQRNNTVGSLTAADISRSLGQGGATVVSAPSVTVNTDNSELNATLGEARDVIDQLSLVLAQGIHAECYIDGELGIARNLDRYNKLKSHT